MKILSQEQVEDVAGAGRSEVTSPISGGGSDGDHTGFIRPPYIGGPTLPIRFYPDYPVRFPFGG